VDDDVEDEEEDEENLKSLGDAPKLKVTSS